MVRVTNVHEAPVLTGPREVPYREHDTGAVGTYDAADPENDTILWSLRGTDRNDFTITGGVLRFVETPDLEDPVDADPDNEYRLTVRASDGEYTDTLAVTVRVSNEEEAGAVSFSPEQPQVGALLTATLTDPDGGISGDEWTWERPQNGSSWTAIAFATSPCYPPVEADLDHYLRVTVSYSDGHGPGKEVVASPDNRTRAAPSNDAAPFFTGSSTDRSVDENSPAMTAVGAPVSATDLGGDTPSGTSAGLCTVDGGTGQIRVKQSTLLDYEEGISYSVTLTASDPANAVARIVVFITVNDVNEAPVAANDEVMTNEDTPATMIPVLANDSDPDPSDVLTVSSHTTPANGSMTVEEVGNTITYTPRADFHGVYTFTYTASGGALSAEASAIVTVRAVNDAPEFPLGSDQRRVATNTAPARKSAHRSRPTIATATRRPTTSLARMRRPSRSTSTPARSRWGPGPCRTRRCRPAMR